MRKPGDESHAAGTNQANLKDSAKLAKKLASHLRVPVLSGARQVARFGMDFGGIHGKTPMLAVRATGEHDVLTTLEFARDHNLPVVVQGSGCSVNGQSLSDNGILLSFVSNKTPKLCLEQGRVKLPANSRWGKVETALARDKRKTPVLADNLSLTVGGTLSVGGYGIDSLRYGSQVSQVRKIRLIRPNGEVHWCTRTQNTDLYRYALAGLGRLGVIEQAEINTVARSRFPVHFSFRHKNLHELGASLEWLREGPTDRPDFFKAFQARGNTISVFGRYTNSLGAARACRLQAPLDKRSGKSRLIAPWHRGGRSLAIKLWVARFGLSRRLWSDFIVDYQGLLTLLDVIENLRRTGDFDDCLKSIYILAVAKPDQPEDIPMDPASRLPDPVNFGIGLYSMIPRNNEAALARNKKAVAVCLDACLASGGRPYLYGWHELPDQIQQDIYGADLKVLNQLRQQGDPVGIFRAPKIIC